MKTPFAFLPVLAAVVCGCSVLAGRNDAFAAEAPKLEVHEWGTFTIVTGSDSLPLRWYQPIQSIAELPAFVGRNWMFGGKGGLGQPASFVRMETPVIYFYPEHAMPVSVRVAFQQGHITEWFPFPSSNDMKDPVEWNGDLVAPDNTAAAAEIPAVIGATGAHYGHAREVPAAWYFHAKLPPNPNANPNAPKVPTWEKFIFYRGAGDAVPSFQANSLEPGKVKLMRLDSGAGDVVAFALRVEGTQARWARLPNLSPYQPGPDNSIPTAELKLDGEAKPIAQVTTELGAAMAKELAAAGLSHDEAKAMVATWSDSWFQENGSRIFALMPRGWVDAVLPLTITPAPQKLTRVFVGRFEMFSPDQENTLATLLAPNGRVDALTKARLRNLHLGRFGNAALERVKAMEDQRMNIQFSQLQDPGPSPLPLPPSTAAR